MFYGFHTGAVRIDGYAITHVLKDIQELNELARRGELEVTAVSAAAYSQVADKYWVMNAGASVGRNYGPVIVSLRPSRVSDVEGKRIAVPGLQTTAYLLARTYLPDFRPVVVRFDHVLDAVRNGKADYALVIHDGQLTYERQGFLKVIDLGEAWYAETKLPIPLGLDLVRKDLGRNLAERFCSALRASIEHSLQNPDGADEYAREFGRDLDLATSARFVRMYVNDDTLDLGPDGRRALQMLLDKASEQGLGRRVESLEFIGA
jgi:1,4-dihydroxy-6-naphthoate synthase